MTFRPDISSVKNPAVTGPIHNFQADHLNVHVYESATEASAAMAFAVRAEIRRRIAERGRAVGIFAAGPSQDEFLDELVKSEDIEWTRVIGFHLQEYLGISEDAPPSSRKYLLDHLVMRVPMAEFHGIRGDAANPEAVCANYAALLRSRPPDFVILDLKENSQPTLLNSSGPDVGDQTTVRIVRFDETVRQQLAATDSFANVAQIPRGVISVSTLAILACPRLFAVASGPNQQQAVRETIECRLTPSSPAPVLRLHLDAILFLDREAAALLPR